MRKIKPNNQIAWALSILMLAICFSCQQKPKQLEDRFKYNIDELKKIDSSEICYAEDSPITCPLQKPKCMVMDNNQIIYLAGELQLIRMNVKGEEINRFITPLANSIALDANKNIYIASLTNISKYDTSGVLLSQWDLPKDSCMITALQPINEFVYAADAGNKVVYQYNLKGEIVNYIGEKNPAKGIKGFIIPSPYFDMAADANNELWVVNPGKHSLEKYSPEGEILTSWKRTSMRSDGFSGCCNPTHISIFENGDFLTSEKGLPRIKIHAANGDYKCMVAPPSVFSDANNGIDICIGKNRIVYALDDVLLQIRVFKPIKK